MARTRDDKNLEKRMLRCVLKEDELAARAQELAKHIGKAQDLHEEKKTVTAEINAKLKDVNEQIRKLADDVNQHTEEREVKCSWKPDTPKTGVKSLVRLDTGEVVQTRNRWNYLTE